MQIEDQEVESVFADDPDEGEPLMTDEEFEEELALASQGRFEEIGLDSGSFAPATLQEFEQDL